MSSIEVRDLGFKRGATTVLREVTARFESGATIGVVGPNGSGKSSLLRTLYGYLPISSGAVIFQGENLEQWAPMELASLLGVCPQEAEPSLDFAVLQVLALPFGGRTEAVHERLDGLGFLKLEGLFDRTLSQLSGGERQRVRLGLALLKDAPWLILDEPANHLDLATAWSLLEYLKRPRNGGVIVALHNLTTAASFCSELLVLHHGEVAAFGSPGEVLSPTLLSDVFSLDAELIRGDHGCTLQIRGVTDDE